MFRVCDEAACVPRKHYGSQVETDRVVCLTKHVAGLEPHLAPDHCIKKEIDPAILFVALQTTNYPWILVSWVMTQCSIVLCR